MSLIFAEVRAAKSLDWKKDIAILDAEGKPLAVRRNRSFEVRRAPEKGRAKWKVLGEAPAALFETRLDKLPDGKRVTVDKPGVIVCGAFVPALSTEEKWRAREGAALQDRVYLILDAEPDELRGCTISLKSGPPVSLAMPDDVKGPPAPAASGGARTKPPDLPPLDAATSLSAPSTRVPSTKPVTDMAATSSTHASNTRPYPLPPFTTRLPSISPHVDIVGMGGRGNLVRFDEAWGLIHANPPNYRMALQLLQQNIIDNPQASDLDYDLGWAMFAAAKINEWRIAASYYDALRQRFPGEISHGAEGAIRNWDDLLVEVKELARRESTRESREALKLMIAADRIRPPIRRK